MHKPLLFARPSLGALAAALPPMVPPTITHDGHQIFYTTDEGYRFNLIPVKTREDGE